MKLFGSTSRRKHEAQTHVMQDEIFDTDKIKNANTTVSTAEKTKKKSKKAKKGKKLLKLFIILAVLAGIYLFLVFTPLEPVSSLRDAYIETAMSTMEHQWMAEWFIPKSVIDDTMLKVQSFQEHQNGVESSWKDGTSSQLSKTLEGKADFFNIFWELDRDSFNDYIDEHPKVIKKGWDNIYINEAGLDDEGTSIKTTQGEQVLAIDAKNKILIVRVEGKNYMGVLAIAKDPSMLGCRVSKSLGSYGELIGDIVEDNGAVLGMTASAFVDVDGVGNGGLLDGYARCDGKDYGNHYNYSSKRIELHEDNLMYIKDYTSAVSSDTTDAVEFRPALVVDGQELVNQYSGLASINPRACIGQSDKGEILMLVIEGRLVGRSLGCDLSECTKILLEHNAYQAMNMDGGTSAIMWYKGEYLTKCSNSAIDSRPLPNAWVYGPDVNDD